MSREKQAINTKNTIANVSMKLFLDKGYEQTSMQDIMSLTGFSKGAVYHHFKSKQEILEYCTKQEQEAIATYLRSLVDDENLAPTQKFEIVLKHIIGNDEMQQLTRLNWVEKIPFGLLNVLRNNMNVLSDYIEEIIIQGNECGEFKCEYPKEVADVLLLLIDIWLDPAIVEYSYSELCAKIDFTFLFAEKFNTPIISREKVEEIKNSLRGEGV